MTVTDDASLKHLRKKKGYFLRKKKPSIHYLICFMPSGVMGSAGAYLQCREREGIHPRHVSSPSQDIGTHHSPSHSDLGAI